MPYHSPMSPEAASEPSAPPRLQALCLGATAGMRAAVAPALVSRHLARHAEAELGALEFLGSPRTARWLELAAAGELLGDKLPSAPSRLEPGPLLGRMASGALCGAALYAAARQRPGAGAVLGGAAAVAGAFAFYHLRRGLTRKGGLPDLLVAALEDALAIGSGLVVLGKGARRPPA